MWEQGRQGTGYLKRRIFEFANRLFGMDCYLIKYLPNTYIPPHTDPVPGFKHFRLNIVLKQTGRGGNLYFYKTRQYGRVFLFRPDHVEHSVSNVDNGTRLVLSIGLVVREKQKSAK